MGRILIAGAFPVPGRERCPSAPQKSLREISLVCHTTPKSQIEISSRSRQNTAPISMNWFKEFWKRLTTPLAPVTMSPAHEIPGFTEQPPFTPRATQTLALARQEAERLRHRFVGTEHVLLGLIRLGQGVAVNVLTALGVDLEAVRSQIERDIPTGTYEEASGPIDFTPKVKRVLALAGKEGKALKHTYLGTEHLLLGLLCESDNVAARVLRGVGVNVEATRDQIRRELEPCFKDDTDIPQ